MWHAYPKQIGIQPFKCKKRPKIHPELHNLLDLEVVVYFFYRYINHYQYYYIIININCNRNINEKLFFNFSICCPCCVQVFCLRCILKHRFTIFLLHIYSSITHGPLHVALTTNPRRFAAKSLYDDRPANNTLFRGCIRVLVRMNLHHVLILYPCIRKASFCVHC